ncbi:GFA family protein [Shewanella sp. GXUN23E]|uniref:GFA family protein n=1 Tax=Shewanella sp. GXUN23E TaxID=3422498 RepID=UPI003D7C9CA6
MTDRAIQLTGGCLCGHIRYRLDGRLIDAGLCHCRICQRSSGAPVVGWLTMSNDSLCYTRGDIATYASSHKYQREFCPYCGTQIAFRAQVNPAMVDVTLSSLDDAEAIRPEYHIWCQSQLSWLHLDDGLPRFDDAGPDEEPV